jgi:hypothetical protein
MNEGPHNPLMIEINVKTSAIVSGTCRCIRVPHPLLLCLALVIVSPAPLLCIFVSGPRRCIPTLCCCVWHLSLHPPPLICIPCPSLLCLALVAASPPFVVASGTHCCITHCLFLSTTACLHPPPLIVASGPRHCIPTSSLGLAVVFASPPLVFIPRWLFASPAPCRCVWPLSLHPHHEQWLAVVVWGAVVDVVVHRHCHRCSRTFIPRIPVPIPCVSSLYHPFFPRIIVLETCK